MTKPTFNIPDRKYSSGPKEMFTARLPARLIEELKLIADKKGWSVSDLVITALDQFAQHELRMRKRR